MGQFLVVPASEAGVKNLPETYGIQVYPNPSNSNLTIHSVKNENPLEKVTVYDLMGQKQCEQGNLNSSQEIKINIEHLSSGQFLLRIETKNGFAFRKFIKQ